MQEGGLMCVRKHNKTRDFADNQTLASSRHTTTRGVETEKGNPRIPQVDNGKRGSGS
jgi:hypothetical protein